MNSTTSRNLLASLSLATLLVAPAAFVSAPASASDTTTPAVQQVKNAAVTASVKARLLADPRTHGFDINVDTDANGRVTLRGTAPSEASRLAAVELTAAIDGVTSVQNDLIVAEPGSVAERSAPPATVSQHVKRGAETGAEAAGDAWITTKVKAALLADREVSGLDIKVKTEDGVVHLQGEVESRRLEARAVELAAAIEGVRRVDTALLKLKS